MDSEAPPEIPSETPPPAPPRRKTGILVVILVVVLAAGAGFFLMRKGVAPAALHSPAVNAAPDALIQGSPVLLNAKASIIADRYNCLCGSCSDTLGRCTCTRDKGSNEMKATLNKLAEEKKSLAEIDAAMTAKYGAGVIVSGAPPPPAAPSPSSSTHH